MVKQKFISTYDCTEFQIHNCGIQYPDPEHTFGPVVRTEFILQYVFGGRGTYRIKDKIYKLKAGDLFLLEPGSLLYYAAEPEDPYTYYWVGFGGADARAWLNRAGFSADKYVLELSDPEVEQTMKTLCEHVFGESEREKLLAVSDFYRLLSLVCRDAPRREAVQNRYVQRAVDFIEKNFAREIGVTEICGAIGLNRSYFSVIFKRAMGVSPVEYLIDYRLKQACRLFSTGASITEISGLCGFGDPSNFSVRFKQHTGYTPRDYRKLMFPECEE